MTREELIYALARIRNDVEKLTKETVTRIVSLAAGYRYLGKEFTFSADADLDRQVNKLLVLLSDELVDELTSLSTDAIDEEEDNGTILPLIFNDATTEKMDSHTSRLKFIIEGWLAVGFANGLTAGSILADIFAFMSNPQATPLWKKAMEDGDFKAGIFAPDAMSWGRGVLKNPISGITLLGQTLVNEAWQRENLLDYGRSGAIGYRTHRASTYDCPVCDELTTRVWPLTEFVLPAHPRCCCYTTPVYELED